ncbi:MAG TPA: DUF4423 domain-containing protein [Polyangiaceae bacterium]|nr:DUF4423 domain-containing protein [Polyangiaceae bacterium]
MDYDGLSAGLIRRVRGKMSTARLSRLLGFSSNVLQLWEQQDRLPDIATFLRLASLRKLRFETGLGELLGTVTRAEANAAPSGDDVSIASVMRRLSGQRSVAELARLSGFDRATITRWCEGKTTPRLPDFLAFLDATTQRLLDFVALFADPREIALTRSAYEEHQKRLRIAYSMPWSSAVLHALELSEYRALPAHDVQLLANKLGLSGEEIDRHLRELLAARLIEERGGRYQPVRVSTVHTQRDFAANRRLKRHWAGVACSRIERLEPEHQSLFSYNVFPIAHGDLDRLRQLHLDYYQRIRHLVANATSADRVVVVNVQLCVLDEVRV